MNTQQLKYGVAKMVAKWRKLADLNKLEELYLAGAPKDFAAFVNSL